MALEHGDIAASDGCGRGIHVARDFNALDGPDGHVEHTLDELIPFGFKFEE